VLEPIWSKKPETASRVRGRIEAILDWATVRGYRQGENPARWKGHLDHLLPARSRVKRVEHHPALPYAEVAAFLVGLRRQPGTAARALDFLVLTAARTSEVIGATWDEVDLDAKIWTIPPERMKGGREHRVPLPERAIEIVAEQKRLSEEGRLLADETGYVFPGQKNGRPLSNMALLVLLRRMKRDDITAHGFRSTFRDWAAETTGFPREVVERALAHAVGDKVEAAYRRGDLFEKRRRLMEAWAKFCATAKPAASVTPFRKASADALA
jgi:integrase